MQEIVKVAGGLAWVAGFVLLWVAPPLGLIVLLVALALSVRSVQMTRERRHRELLNR